MIDFHPITYFVVLTTFFLVPALVFGTYYFSGQGSKKALYIATGTTIWAGIMWYFCLFKQSSLGEVLVTLILVANLIWPSLMIFLFKDYFVGEGLNMYWLTGIQVFRNIGALFLLENARGLVGTTFAYFAGIGDVIVGMTALYILFLMFRGERVSNRWYYFLISIGVIDFISAVTFGTLSSPLPIQIFAFGENHLVSQYPLGLIPFLLVPLALSFHALMYLTLLRKSKQLHDPKPHNWIIIHGHKVIK
jgi:hypothetical protein